MKQTVPLVIVYLLTMIREKYNRQLIDMENTCPNWLVSIEIAKNLKDIGFDEPCLITNYNYDTDIETNFISFNYNSCSDINVDILECKFGKNSDFKDVHKEYPVNITTIPTWEQIFQWFREKFKLNVIISPINKYVDNPQLFGRPIKILHTFYYFEIFDENVGEYLKIGKYLPKSVSFDTYEKARYTAIKTVIDEHIKEIQ